MIEKKKNKRPRRCSCPRRWLLAERFGPSLSPLASRYRIARCFRNVPLVTIAFVWATFASAIRIALSSGCLRTRKIIRPRAVYERPIRCYRRVTSGYLRKPISLSSLDCSQPPFISCDRRRRAVVVIPFPVVRFLLSCTRLTSVAFSYSWLLLKISYHV